jgi:hypothetical protein
VADQVQGLGRVSGRAVSEKCLCRDGVDPDVGIDRENPSVG